MLQSGNRESDRVLKQSLKFPSSRQRELFSSKQHADRTRLREEKRRLSTPNAGKIRNKTKEKHFPAKHFYVSVWYAEIEYRVRLFPSVLYIDKPALKDSSEAEKTEFPYLFLNSLKDGCLWKRKEERNFQFSEFNCKLHSSQSAYFRTRCLRNVRLVCNWWLGQPLSWGGEMAVCVSSISLLFLFFFLRCPSITSYTFRFS